jgi:multiple sugar transport system ATP-binding protein
LDAKLRVSTRAQIKNLSHELAVTTIYVTHDQIEAMTLADRVVVMEKGIVQQVGSPTEIYDRPANTFVAGFIGNPAMNLIEGSAKNGVFSAASTEIAGLATPDQNVTLGFRAEDASVVEKGGQINAPIYTLELLGDATMVTVRIGSTLVSVRADKNYRASIDDMVSIAVPAEICHLFDGQTGARIGD